MVFVSHRRGIPLFLQKKNHTFLHVHFWLARNFFHFLLSQSKIWACLFVSSVQFPLWKQVLTESIFSNDRKHSRQSSSISGFGFCLPIPILSLSLYSQKRIFQVPGKLIIIIYFTLPLLSSLPLADFQCQLPFAVLGGLSQLKSQLSQWNVNLTCLYVTFRIRLVR